MNNKFAIRFGCIVGLSLLAAGCDSTNASKKSGSYTAARHAQLGSHIPQPAGVDNTNSTQMSDAELERVARQQESLMARGAGGGQ